MGRVDAGFCAACLSRPVVIRCSVVELLRALQRGAFGRGRVRSRGYGSSARLRSGRPYGAGSMCWGSARRRWRRRSRSWARAFVGMTSTVRRRWVVELEEALAGLASAGIVRSEERVSFVHPLVADAVRASLSRSESARLHQQAVRALSERGASPRELAPHLVAGAVELIQALWESCVRRRGGRWSRALPRQR